LGGQLRLRLVDLRLCRARGKAALGDGFVRKHAGMVERRDARGLLIGLFGGHTRLGDGGAVLRDIGTQQRLIEIGQRLPARTRAS
jgi:hypothetical protein